MAVLRTHTAGGVKHPPTGQFAAPDAASDDEWLPLPVDSADGDGGEFVLTTLIDFGLDRLDRSGLSVVVPYPKPDLTPAAIARVVITQYFLPIVREDLVVEITAPGERARTIDADTIAREVVDIARPDSEDTHDEETPDSLAGVIRLAQWAIRQDADAHIALSVPTRTNNTLELLDLERLRERYENNERLAFRIDIGVQRQGGTSTPCDFRLYLERAEGLPQGHDYFVRGHLSIPRMDHIQRHKARVLVTVDGESELGHLLRDSEGPAHVSWDPHEQRLKDRWRGGYARVQEVRRAAVLLLQRLVERPDEQQFDALADLFPADPEPSRGRKPSTRPGAGPSSTDTPPPRRPSPLEVSRTADGFSVRPPQDATGLGGSEWSLRFAYDTVRGDPFQLFERGAGTGVPDFSIGDGVEVRERSAEVERVADNALRFRALGDDLRLDVTGLDDRDLIVDVEHREAPADAETEAPA